MFQLLAPGGAKRFVANGRAPSPTSNGTSRTAMVAAAASAHLTGGGLLGT